MMCAFPLLAEGWPKAGVVSSAESVAELTTPAAPSLRLAHPPLLCRFPPCDLLVRKNGVVPAREPPRYSRLRPVGLALRAVR